MSCLWFQVGGQGLFDLQVFHLTVKTLIFLLVSPLLAKSIEAIINTIVLNELSGVDLQVPYLTVAAQVMRAKAFNFKCWD